MTLKRIVKGEPIAQIPWYLQIRKEIYKGRRAIDYCSVFDIVVMYDQQYFICDDCGAHIGNDCIQTKQHYPLSDHMAHLINPMLSWVCEGCYQKDMTAGSILGECKS